MSGIHSFPDYLTIATYVALLVSILGLWLARSAWIGALIVAIALGYASGVLAGGAVLGIALVAGLCVLYERLRRASRTPSNRAAMIATAIGIAASVIVLGMHAWPGFNNLLVAKNVVLSAGAAPYTLYLNFDKTVAGILIIGILVQPMMRTGAEWMLALKRAAPIIVLNIVVLILLALPIDYLRFDPKWSDLFWIWAPANLFFTCLSEEAFFRGFIQRELSNTKGLAIAASALLFGLAHFAGGWSYVLLATIAGAGYAWVFQRTQRIEMSMLAHFALNATHFLLLTYPRTG
jgi:membrane protease YdiL (CAAX protease family)